MKMWCLAVMCLVVILVACSLAFGQGSLGREVAMVADEATPPSAPGKPAAETLGESPEDKVCPVNGNGTGCAEPKVSDTLPLGQSRADLEKAARMVLSGKPRSQGGGKSRSGGSAKGGHAGGGASSRSITNTNTNDNRVCIYIDGVPYVRVNGELVKAPDDPPAASKAAPPGGAEADPKDPPAQNTGNGGVYMIPWWLAVLIVLIPLAVWAIVAAIRANNAAADARVRAAANGRNGEEDDVDEDGTSPEMVEGLREAAGDERADYCYAAVRRDRRGRIVRKLRVRPRPVRVTTVTRESGLAVIDLGDGEVDVVRLGGNGKIERRGPRPDDAANDQREAADAAQAAQKT